MLKFNPSPDINKAVLRELMDSLTSSGYATYLTSVGGSGLGVLSPWTNIYQGPVTPPESRDEIAEGTAQDNHRDSLRTAFNEQSITKLTEWADGRGRWLYV